MTIPTVNQKEAALLKFMEPCFYFYPSSDAEWIVKITHEGKFIFNKEAYPDAVPDDFAKAFIGILENTILKTK